MLKIFFGKCSKNQAPNLCQKPSKAVGNLLRLSLYQTKAHAEYIERETYLPGVNTTRYDGSHLYQPLTGSNHPTTTIVHLEGGGDSVASLSSPLSRTV